MSVAARGGSFGWAGIFRLGLVQASLGAIVILMTSTLNRVMVVELSLAAAIPGALVAWHYAVQISRPRWGFGADTGARRTPWILGGMAVLALGATGAALSTALIPSAFWPGLIGAAVSFSLVGAGVGAAGTNLLALLAIRTEPSRKAAAAAIVWIMMIMGFVLTAGIGGAMLEPFSLGRLVLVTASVGAVAVTVAALALWGIERAPADAPAPAERAEFLPALREVWQEQQARRFTIFVFVSMLAYSAQDLILEPFAGLVHGYSASASTQLAGVQNMGTLAGMLLTAVIATAFGRSRAAFMRLWTFGGCLASAAALLALAAGAPLGTNWPLVPNVFALGVANGAFAVAAIGSMMTFASQGRAGREGTRMGLWGAAQAIAFGAGSLAGAVALDAARAALSETGDAFALVFATEGLLFIAAGAIALWTGRPAHAPASLPALAAGEYLPAN